MKNGNVLLAMAEEVNDALNSWTSLTYYQEPIPCQLDRRLDETVDWYVMLDREQRGEFLDLLSPEVRALFGIYGHRAATRANRQSDVTLLHRGLIGAIVANHVIPEKRRLEVGLVIYHHAARKLGIEPGQSFADAAEYADGELAVLLDTFGRRQDITLRQYGWKEINTAEGVLYRFDWK